MCGFYCIVSIEYMFVGKILLGYTNLFAQNDCTNNDQLIYIYILYIYILYIIYIYIYSVNELFQYYHLSMYLLILTGHLIAITIKVTCRSW